MFVSNATSERSELNVYFILVHAFQEDQLALTRIQWQFSKLSKITCMYCRAIFHSEGTTVAFGSNPCTKKYTLK